MEKLRAEHRRLIAAVERIEAITGGAYHEPTEAQQGDRWAFTRDLLLHLTHEEGQVLLPLMHDTRPDVARKAVQAREAAQQFYHDFRAHALHWRGVPTRDRWDEYCQAVKALMRRLRLLMIFEEQHLYPLIPPEGFVARVDRDSINYAAAAWEIRSILEAAAERASQRVSA